jgi:hypothetical protein
MMKKPIMKHLAIIVVVWLTCAPNAWSNIVINGGFEQDLSIGWTSYSVDRAPGTSLSVTYFNPYEGNYAVDLEGSGIGNLSGYVKQTLNTIPGQGYALQFAMGGNYWEWSDYIKDSNNQTPVYETKYAEVLWDGNSLGTFSYNLHPGDTITNFTWDLHGLVIPGSSVQGQDVLEFISINPQYSGYGAFIDDITVVGAVPEPTTLLLLGLSLVGLAGARRKLKN